MTSTEIADIRFWHQTTSTYWGPTGSEVERDDPEAQLFKAWWAQVDVLLGVLNAAIVTNEEGGEVEGSLRFAFEAFLRFCISPAAAKLSVEDLGMVARIVALGQGFDLDTKEPT